MSHSSNHFAIAMVVLAGIMWAGSGVGAQNFFEKCSMNAMELTAFRMIAAGCILIGVTVWQGKMKESLICLRKKPRLWIDILIYAIVGLMLMHYTYFEAIAYGNAATATVVLYSFLPWSSATIPSAIASCHQKRRSSRSFWLSEAPIFW